MLGTPLRSLSPTRRSGFHNAKLAVPVTTRLVAVEDDRRYRASLETLFAHATGFRLVETFASGDAALNRVEGLRRRNERPPWDLVLMDLELPGTDGITCTRALKERIPGLSVVVVTVLEDANAVLQAICAGADGYLTKRTPPAEILAELQTIMGGGSPLSAGVARTVLTLLRSQATPRRGALEAARFELTERELAVLQGLVQGFPYKRVADELGISIDTVRSHVRHVYAKLQVHSVAQAVGRAIREGLV
jgi:DNA-binding NarL/FixJ family response regulator